MSAKRCWRRSGEILLIAVCECSRSAPPPAAVQADRLRQAGDLAAAYTSIARGLCREPASLELARQLVQDWDALGRPGTPMASLRGCHITEVTTDYTEGLTAAAAGDIATADRHFAAALERATGKQRSELSYRWGLVALHSGAYDVALERLQVAAGATPERCDVRLAIAGARLERGDHSGAVDELRSMLQISPSAEQLAHGRDILDVVVRRSEQPLPDDVEATLARTLSGLDRAELSRDDMLAAIDLANEFNHPRVLTVAGIAALRFGAEREASRLLTRAAELNPLDPDPPRALGISLFAAARYSEALTPLVEAHSRDPFDPAVARRLGQTAVALGDRDAAREAFRALTVLEPEVAENFLHLAQVERQLGNLVGAKVAVEAGYRLDGKNIPLLLERAAIHAQLARAAADDDERQSEIRVARNTVEELLEVSPEYPGAGAILKSLEQ